MGQVGAVAGSGVAELERQWDCRARGLRRPGVDPRFPTLAREKARRAASHRLFCSAAAAIVAPPTRPRRRRHRRPSDQTAPTARSPAPPCGRLASSRDPFLRISCCRSRNIHHHPQSWDKSFGPHHHEQSAATYGQNIKVPTLSEQEVFSASELESALPTSQHCDKNFCLYITMGNWLQR